MVLSNNQFTDSIPSSFGNLRNLHSLFLGNNNLIEEIPSSFCNLTSLTILSLSRNRLKGKILQCLGNISGLLYVMMSNNNLSGELPLSICNLTSLQGLDLGRNNLMGAIPQCLGNMSGHLEVLDMQHNDLSGTLPTTFSIGSALRSFNLHGNKLEGKIPRSLKNCKELQVLDLGDNHLNDTFPMWLGTLPELRVISLRSNKLHGPIRTSGSEYMFLELRILDLSCNDFSKNLPMSLFQHLKSMRTIDQKIDGLSYELHQHYQDSVDVVSKGLELEVVRICHIPPSLGNLSAVESLDLSDNHLVGEIPAQFASLTALEVLNLSYNHLEGCIPQGPQFHTFENNSYEGNDGLRGFPLSNGCGNDGHDSVSEETYTGSALDEESNSEFLNNFSKAALMGRSRVQALEASSSKIASFEEVENGWKKLSFEVGTRKVAKLHQQDCNSLEVHEVQGIQATD
ncbi:putative 3-oxoacyl-[acyl-carrier-protein] reductase 3, chloroplastic-like [Capsicum annuum]|nr:putative 3-oxoacyl-[acyl-carrier-protein] reductase 3, chloroplastic-like [Capsicum annuum]KAF3669120.1 putative 3-oxoacyl-[acyl-carrier-protein] reductase 3, chloroplastic-like [Capsicum annuum]